MSLAIRLNPVLVSAVMALTVAACSQASNNNAAQTQSGAAASAAPSAAPAAHIRGTITAANASTLTIMTAHGAVTVAVAPTTGVAGVVPGSLSDIKPNTFIGSANVPGARAARALEVVVFPDSMRGTGEGNYAWDLPANGQSSSMMTNGTVSASQRAHGGSMMTNGTVSQASSAGPLVLTVAYKGGTVHLTVPPNTPVVRIVPGDRSLLVPGAHVFAVAKPGNGQIVAARIIVGEHGAVPPM